MNVRQITILILIVAMGYIGYSYSQKVKQQKAMQPPSEKMQQSATMNVQDVKKMVETQAAAVNEKMENTVAEANQAMEEAGETMIDKGAAMKEDLQAKVDELIQKAKSLLASGNFEGAIAAAKEVLTKYAPDSAEAKSIIEQAKQKIAEKAAEMKEGAMDSVTDAMGSFGQ